MGFENNNIVVVVATLFREGNTTVKTDKPVALYPKLKIKITIYTPEIIKI